MAAQDLDLYIYSCIHARVTCGKVTTGVTYPFTIIQIRFHQLDRIHYYRGEKLWLKLPPNIRQMEEKEEF